MYIARLSRDPPTAHTVPLQHQRRCTYRPIRTTLERYSGNPSSDDRPTRNARTRNSGPRGTLHTSSRRFCRRCAWARRCGRPIIENYHWASRHNAILPVTAVVTLIHENTQTERPESFTAWAAGYLLDCIRILLNIFRIVHKATPWLVSQLLRLYSWSELTRLS